MCFSTARSVTTSSAAMAALVIPRADHREHLQLTRRQPIEHRVGRRRAGRDQRVDDELVDDRTAGGDDPQGRDELVDIGHPLLEEIAPTVAALAHEVQGVFDVGVLRQRHHPDRPGGSGAVDWRP